MHHHTEGPQSLLTRLGRRGVPRLRPPTVHRSIRDNVDLDVSEQSSSRDRRLSTLILLNAIEGDRAMRAYRDP